MSTTKSNCTVQTYLCFEGRCEEAIEFYKRAVGAEVVMMLRFKDNPEPAPTGPAGCAPSSPDKIMHAQLTIGGAVVMASDGRCTGKATFSGFSMSLTTESEADAEKYFGALSEGGQVQMPLAKTFFAKKFGMVADKFGIGWMIMVRP